MRINSVLNNAVKYLKNKLYNINILNKLVGVLYDAVQDVVHQLGQLGVVGPRFLHRGSPSSLLSFSRVIPVLLRVSLSLLLLPHLLLQLVRIDAVVHRL